MARAEKQCIVYLVNSALQALEAHLKGRDEGYVFEGRDMGHISTRQIQRLLETVAEKAGLQEGPCKVRQRKRITPHLLRHSFSRWSLDAGIDISYLQLLAVNDGDLPASPTEPSKKGV
jgi:site-specific recombinase XerD